MLPVQAVLALALVAVASAALLPPPPDGSAEDQGAAGARTVGQEDNATRLDAQGVDDGRNVSKLDVDKLMSPVTRTRGCPLSTCHVTQLGERLQGGDEVAGGSTTDPLGPGRK